MKTKFKIKNWRKKVTEYLLIISFFMSIFSAVLFVVGFHNLDSGHNLKYINTKYNLTLVDTSNLGHVATGDMAYTNGMNQMFIAFALEGLSMFIFGLCLSKFKYKEDKKR